MTNAEMWALIQEFTNASSFGSPKKGNAVKIVNGMILKQIKAPDAGAANSQIRNYETELKLARDLSVHPNLIDVFGTAEGGGFGYICMELGTPSYDPPHHMNLRDAEFCRKHGMSVECIFCTAVRDFSAGVNHVHKHGFNVADLKLKNSVMFDVGPQFKFKLIDFGKAVVRTRSDTSSGDPWDLIPESIHPMFGMPSRDEDEAFGNTRLDEFLLGCMLLDILTWTKNYARTTSYALQTTYAPSMGQLKPRSIPTMGVDWLDSLVSWQPSKRISMDKLSSIPEDTIHTDFGKLHLPFFMGYTPWIDYPKQLCMRDMKDAY